MPPFWGLSTATRCQPSFRSIDGSAHTSTPQLRFGRRLPPSVELSPTSCQSSRPSGRPNGVPRSLPRMIQRKAMVFARPTGTGAPLLELGDSRSVLVFDEAQDTVLGILSFRLQVSGSVMAGSGRRRRKVVRMMSWLMSPLPFLRKRGRASATIASQRFPSRSWMNGSVRVTGTKVTTDGSNQNAHYFADVCWKRPDLAMLVFCS